MAQVLARSAGWQPPPGLAAEPLFQLVEQRPVGLAQVMACIGQGLLEKPLVLGRAAASIEVGAVHRVVRDQRLQGAADRPQGQVAAHQVVAGHLQQGLGHRFAVAGQAGVEHQVAGLAHFLGKRRALAEVAPQLGQRYFAGRIVLQQRDLVHELVAGGAVGEPVTVQVFAGTEDFLDVDREVLDRRGQGPPGQQCIDAPAQFAAIPARVGQAVDVVDAQAIHQAALDQFEQLGMGGLEHRGALDPQPAQLVDIEKAPPVDVVGGGAPAGQAIGLAFEQQVQALETRLAAAVEGDQGGAEVGAFAHLSAQLGLQGQGVRQWLGRGMQGGEVLGQRLQARLGALREDPAIVERADREAVLVVSDLQQALVLIVLQGNLAVLQGGAIVAAQERQQQLAGQQWVAGMPLDIEEFGIRAASSPGQQALPPRVVGTAHGHVVGHGVEDQPHAVLAQGADQALQRRLAAQLRVDLGRVDHVVAVARAGAGLEDRRGVQVADAQLGEIRHQRYCLVEGEVTVKLQAQCRGQRLHRSRSQACSRAWASSSRRRAASSSSSSSATGRAKRRRQLGWPSVVPGRFGCWSQPSRSSSGISTSGARVWPT
ncbi:hypothetical protein D3C79_626960 [compost metagenome]